MPMVHIYADSAHATFVGVPLPQLARLGGASGMLLMEFITTRSQTIVH